MNLATERQIAAARPDASTWLAANAGSGKTRVLTNRVARLLLSGVAPQTVLCLTYTKAAAGEMQNRLFATLGAWAMMPEDDLRAELTRLGETRRLDADDLARARRLFARAIETPGGLKIQTIHAFCGAILRRFPLEAGVSPAFTEIDPRTVKVLVDTVLEDIADGPDAGALDAIARMLDEGRIGGLCADLLSHRAAFDPPATPEAIRADLGLDPDHDSDRLVADTFGPGDPGLLSRLVAALSAGTKTDVKAAETLAPLFPFAPSMALIEALEGPLLYGAGAKEPFAPKTGSFPTKGTRAKLGEDAAALDGLMTRIADARDVRIALQSAVRTEALHRFAGAFLPRVDRLKRLRGWLDFDDLVLKVRALLTDPSVAQWVLYKLDGGIEHILVDEAQDTSPEQWDIIRLLAQEFTAGTDEGRGRTIFVVGDRKQSIYSFQGADPREFDRLRGHFRDRLAEVGQSLADGQLAHSFRSAPAVLTAVDAAFDGPSGLGDAPEHVAFRDALPGRVDMWPPVEDEEEETTRENAEGWDPVDRREPTKASARLAGKMARRVKTMIEQGSLGTEASPRALTPGDVLILFRRRGTLFYQTLNALKGLNLPVAGADRIKLKDELAVRDLIALLAFLALPEDELSLAAALRSPLFGWSEDDLFRLAHERPPGVRLWPALRRSERDTATFAVLDDLSNQTDYLRPFDLIDRILTRHGGRARLVGRLGAECEEGIDALLAQALDYERVEVPSLTGFLEWMGAEDVEVKRQAEGAAGRIRLMTVHGAKGLEAPVVILPDCGAWRSRNDPGMLLRDGGFPVWRPSAAEAPQALRPALGASRDREAEERDRLLYVAMTRAEQWLIVAAAGDMGRAKTWHGQVSDGLQRAGAERMPMPSGEGLRLTNGTWPARPAGRPEREPDDHAEPAAVLPAWTRTHATAPPPETPTLAPTALGGAKALPGEGHDEATALRLGTAVHLLLEHLSGHPQADWPLLAPGILGATATDAELPALLDEATAVLSSPDLAELFAPETLAEVPLSAPVPALGRIMGGTIDRLIVTPERVLAVDFKSNRTVPATPETVPDGILRQMGAYSEMLAAIYPDRRIETAILWTRSAQLMPLPRETVTAALRRAEPLS